MRESTTVPGDYVLSMSSKRQPFHFQIQHFDGKFSIDDGPVFRNLEDTIHHYKHDADGLPTFLREYAERCAVTNYHVPVVLPLGKGRAPIEAPSQRVPARNIGTGEESTGKPELDLDYDHMDNIPERIGPWRSGGAADVGADTSPLMIHQEQLRLMEELGSGECMPYNAVPCHAMSRRVAALPCPVMSPDGSLVPPPPQPPPPVPRPKDL